jgi:HSP20 family molecular chaperone IbpA
MAGLAFEHYGGDFVPMPIVDHPHERTHQHRTFFQYLARQNPAPEQNPNRPDVDIRDVVTGYLVEIEVPGVKSTREIAVEWISNNILVVIGSVERTARNESLKGRDSLGDSKASEGQTYGEGLIIGERRIGPFRRYINFPVEIDADKVTAKLEAGLLILRAPKAEHHVPKHKLNIEVVA